MVGFAFVLVGLGLPPEKVSPDPLWVPKLRSFRMAAWPFRLSVLAFVQSPFVQGTVRKKISLVVGPLSG